MSEWIALYAQSHEHRVNRICHMIGIPLIALSVAGFVLTIFIPGLWKAALGLFLLGWVFQFVGHYVEGKPPEFVHDWRFLLVGLRWWTAKVGRRSGV